MGRTQYDDSVIQAFADRLYRQARLSTLVWLLLGAFAGAAFGMPLVAASRGGLAPSSVGVAAVIGGVLGAALGHARGQQLRLQAQSVLCQRQIELNTRRSDAG